MHSPLLAHHSKLRNGVTRLGLFFFDFLNALKASLWNFLSTPFISKVHISVVWGRKSLAIALPSRNSRNRSVQLGWITEWSTNCLIHMIRDHIWGQRVKQSIRPKDDRKYPSMGGSSQHDLRATQRRSPFCFLPGVPSTPWGSNTQSKSPT